MMVVVVVKIKEICRTCFKKKDTFFSLFTCLSLVIKMNIQGMGGAPPHRIPHVNGDGCAIQKDTFYHSNTQSTVL